MATPSISTNVHYAGIEPRRDVTLPDIEGAPVYQPALLDRIGDLVREHPWLPITGGVLGGVAAGVFALRGGHGLSMRLASPIGGAIAGSALALAAGAAITGLRGPDDPHRSAPVASAEVRADEDLRVMTFNVHGGMGPEGAFGTSAAELDRVARTISEEDPDVVLLQEVDRFATRSSHRDTIAELARRLHPDGAAFTPRGTLVTGRQEGTGILTFNGTEIADARGLVAGDPHGSGVLRRIGTSISGGIRAVRKEVLRQENVLDTGTPDYFPRVTTDAMLVTPGGNHVRVLDGHYNGPREGSDYQAAQVAPVAGLLDGWTGPTLWGADWNVASASVVGRREAQLLGHAGLRDTFTEDGTKPGSAARRTYGAVPRNEIDRIYASDQFETLDVRVGAFDPDEPGPSDHHPVTVDLRLRASRTGDRPA